MAVRRGRGATDRLPRAQRARWEERRSLATLRRGPPVAARLLATGRGTACLGRYPLPANRAPARASGRAGRLLRAPPRPAGLFPLIWQRALGRRARRSIVRERLQADQ